MSRLKIILLGLSAFFSLVALGVIALIERKNINPKRVPGSPEQLAEARKAKARKALLKKLENENFEQDEQEEQITENKSE
jgi:uncharacterized protein with ACT and thioredoxin-like domain